jgi:hypothetical protein
MVLYSTGQKVRASELNVYRQVAFLEEDVTNASTDLTGIAGFAFSGDSNTRYLVQVRIAYNVSYLRDMQLKWAYPDGSTGWWTARGVDAAATSNDGSTGDFNAQAVALSQIQAFTGWQSTPSAGDDMYCSPVTTILIGDTAGLVRLQFALYDDASGTGACTIKAGAVLRALRLTQ